MTHGAAWAWRELRSIVTIVAIEAVAIATIGHPHIVGIACALLWLALLARGCATDAAVPPARTVIR